MATITHYPAGELPDTFALGDIGLVSDPKTPDLLDQLIQARERAEYGHHPIANLNHSFGIADKTGVIIEANDVGVQRQDIAKYKDADLYVIHVDATGPQRALCVNRWQSCVGMEYDKVMWFSLGFQTLFGWHLLLSDDHGLICSALVCYGALAYEVAFQFPYQAMTPADIACHFGLPLDEPPVPLGVFARFLDGLRTVMRAISPF